MQRRDINKIVLMTSTSFLWYRCSCTIHCKTPSRNKIQKISFHAVLIVHRTKMKNHKPSHYSNYITIKDVFHPESLYATEQAPPTGTAEVVVIDESPHPAAGANKWNVVWAEATLLNDDSKDSGGENNNNSIPHPISTATASASSSTTPTLTVLDAPYHHSGLLESAIGIPLMIGAVAATALTELGALLVYGTAVAMHAFALKCKQTNCGVFSFIPQLLYFIFELHVAVLMLCDYILLISSVIISESLAFSCWMVNSILSCFRCGMPWHQYIRRVCHVTRWAFRDFHVHWEPSRAFPCGRPNEDNDQPPHSATAPTADPENAIDPYDASKPEYCNDSDF